MLTTSKSPASQGMDPYGVYSPHTSNFVKSSSALASAPRSALSAYASYDHVKALQEPADVSQPVQQPQPQSPALTVSAPTALRYVDFHAQGSFLQVEPEDVQLTDRRFFVGLYQACDAPVVWDKRGKGFAGIRYQPRQNCVLLFILAAAPTMELVYTLVLTGLLQISVSGSSIEWRESGSSKRMAMTFQSASLCSELFESITNVIEAEKSVIDPKGRGFWHAISSQRAFVEWNGFVQALIQELGQFQRGDLDWLKEVLHISIDLPVVTLANYSAYLAWFGAFHQAVARMRQLMSQPWFKGFASRNDADAMLRSTGMAGTFLLRFSSSMPGSYAMSYLEQETTGFSVRHVLISPSKSADGYTLDCADGGVLHYRTLTELVEQEFAKLRHPLSSASAHLSAAAPSSERGSKVAVYRMSEKQQWDTICTGFAKCVLESQPCSFVIRVVSEDGGQLLFSADMKPDLEINKQNERSIVWRTVEGLRFALSFELAEHCTEMWTKLHQMRLVTPEQQAEEFWQQEQWPLSALMRWADFLAALKRQLRGSVDDVADYIKYILFYPNSESADAVSVELFTKFLAWFGPLQECMPRLTEVVDQEWFHWFISREQAEQLLRPRTPGTFLIRFSSQQGSFALSYVDRLPEGGGAAVIQHTLITRDLRCGNAALIMSKVGGGVLEYSTLKQLVDNESAKLLTPCPRS
eukprot:TRINITY_DN245_c0_g1_i1.p1 TRINITY_DN245_c0_g1~~TRINITY_DN245_c0_g1_i1.p1  ORF type:complete len:694 (-),score=114.10 TRINITY_DN245_c0_g1_i1:443-2524(-)